ncbi:von Willebrand factor A domain-containing protein 8-like isoform X2 [Lytechinus variegatus]|uniref:von Willebrand factor A domain-containing protein 8-like isoform X1 n=1 Tax=Lytechinus variegatus TaxID=7654 RepID=UPI001BB18FEB|nr:von Willebrand factor A domain-containing protein 8-like isoform X1 [Lytechinus variegatus]XP_041484899.1 von Willebrand factor A domain-containing protein 8-like isoform X2 [Lytechinus variegatus]
MFRVARMSSELQSVRRLRQLHSLLQGHQQQGALVIPNLRCRAVYSTDGKSVSLGGVTKTIKEPARKELVPIKYLPENVPQSVLRHLRWIMQKDSLGQDVFLIGAPGPLRRAIAMQYLELTKREVEYMALSRDTTESDLKQRREIKSSTAFYIDQCAVRAATEGRVLVLEGIEKAERNVLPVLNNLLENREMQLEDGRFLVASERYDKLLKDHTKEELERWKLVRVNEDFRVIALGLPVPKYRGNPLDPPLRSRFQARDVNPLAFRDHLQVLSEEGSAVPSERLSQLLSFATTLRSEEISSLGLPDFPLDNLSNIVQILNKVPSASVHGLIHQLYPYEVFLNKEGQESVLDALQKFELRPEKFEKPPKQRISDVVQRTNQDGGFTAAVNVEVEGHISQIQVPTGVNAEKQHDVLHKYISTSTHDGLLADMVMSHSVGDFCLVGPKGCGKSVLAREFAEKLGYNSEIVMLYQDMTSRDLLQQRITELNGDTAWRLSPLVKAALEGSIALLDGLHRVNPSTLAVLHRLVHDREVTLFDGTRLLRHDRYDQVKQDTSLSDAELAERSIMRIHPSFRIIALAEPPQVGSSSQQWLNPELLTLFMYHHIKPLTMAEEMTVIQGMVPNAPTDSLDSILQLTHRLRHAADPNLQSVASSLSTRNLIRIAHRLAHYQDQGLHDAVHKACLSRFLPSLARQSLEQALEDAGIVPPPKESQSIDDIEKATSCEIKDNVLRVGRTEMALYNPENRMMVPDTLFYENPQHLSIMEDMLKDFTLGEHLLLVGNQGVGKNKLVDRFLHLLNRPRQYIQLHRDTTVQTLTLQPNVQDGVIVYEDSPLVKAVKYGHILVVDEADKAPTHVTCVLKALVESGEMMLADGRRIVSAQSGMPPSDDIIITHPDFSMMVLANRPGFPFLGNDFFGSLGDIFSCHAIDNPDIESEMAMLQRYGPDVPKPILRKLVLAFSELRSLADQGLIAYPYSTREVVNMVKHLQRYPDEGLPQVVKNVFDFDAYNNEMREQVVETLHKHGIPIGASTANVQLAKEFPLPPASLSGRWLFGDRGASKRKMMCPVEEKKLRVKGPAHIQVREHKLDRVDSRASSFNEQMASWQLPMNEMNIPTDVAVTKEKSSEMVHVCVGNPISLYSMKPLGQSIQFLDLYDVFPYLGYRPAQLAALGGPLQGQVVLNDPKSHTSLLIDPSNGSVWRLYTTGLLEETVTNIRRTVTSGNQQDQYKMCSEFAHENWLVFYVDGGSKVEWMDVLNGDAYTVNLPMNIKSLKLASPDAWLLVEAKTDRKYLMTRPSHDAPVSQLHAIFDASPGDTVADSESSASSGSLPLAVSHKGLSKDNLSSVIGENMDAPNRLMADPNSYGSVAVGFPDLQSSVDVYSAPRPAPPSAQPSGRDPLASLMKKSGTTGTTGSPVVLPDSAQVVRVLNSKQVPKEVFPDEKVPVSGEFLEIADMSSQTLKYIPIPSPTVHRNYTPWVSDSKILTAPTPSEGVVTVDSGGHVRLWETGRPQLSKSLTDWYKMIGTAEDAKLQITYDKDEVGDISEPKFGEIDQSNNPHVGGNRWAGGTGGRDTAGMGGIGGPFRLDAGHDVHQVSQAMKDAVPEEVRKAAREMAQKAYKARLKEIEMSEYDAETYERFSDSVKRQVTSLRVILDSLQAKAKERQWIKHQSSGDLDEVKLIEGLTGEKAIYKRRGEQDPEMGSPQEHPKRLRLVVDVSGSMYRFNGHDGRLDRTLQAICMAMEAFEGYEEKFAYDIVGHSGETCDEVFLKSDKVPKNNNERLKVLRNLHAHAQFCLSGDNTVEAAKTAIQDIVKEEADEYFVIILSDANLDRYGISPKVLSRVMQQDEDVNAYAIFIGSIGDQAGRLVRNLPAGHGFVCMDTKTIPQIMQQIFTSTLLK